MPKPKFPEDVKCIIGMLSYYRRFVPDFLSIVAPLTRLTRKSEKLNWTEECEKSFNQIKTTLVTPPILTCPNWQYPFIIQTDASTLGLGCLLFQDYDGRDHVVCYLSRSLTKNEVKFGSTQLEIFAVIWTIEKLRGYIEGQKSTVVTDNYALKWINELKDPKARLGRWCLKLQKYDFDVIHRKGILNVLPDCLSRTPESTISSVNLKDNEAKPKISGITDYTTTF